MTAGEYWKRVASLDASWKITNPIKLVTYNPSKKNLTVEIKKSQKEAAWKLRWDYQKVYLGIKDVWKEKIHEAYGRSWIKEIEYKVINFTHKSEE